MTCHNRWSSISLRTRVWHFSFIIAPSLLATLRIKMEVLIIRIIASMWRKRRLIRIVERVRVTAVIVVCKRILVIIIAKKVTRELLMEEIALSSSRLGKTCWIKTKRNKRYRLWICNKTQILISTLACKIWSSMKTSRKRRHMVKKSNQACTTIMINKLISTGTFTIPSSMSNLLAMSKVNATTEGHHHLVCNKLMIGSNSPSMTLSKCMLILTRKRYSLPKPLFKRGKLVWACKRPRASIQMIKLHRGPLKTRGMLSLISRNLSKRSQLVKWWAMKKFISKIRINKCLIIRTSKCLFRSPTSHRTPMTQMINHTPSFKQHPFQRTSSTKIWMPKAKASEEPTKNTKASSTPWTPRTQTQLKAKTLNKLYPSPATYKYL